MLHMEAYQTYDMHFVSFLNDFCPCILSFVSCTNFITFWNQYADSIVNPLAYVPVWCCVWICQV